MAMTPQPCLEALPDSRYAAELRKSPPSVRLPEPMEREFVRDTLRTHRPVVRVACALALVLLLLRSAQLLAAGTLLAMPQRAAILGVVVLSNAALVGLAFSGAYERFYLPVARWLVPLRNALIAVAAVQVLARGDLVMLMVLPPLVIGPLFFLGLPVRAGVFSGALALVCALAGALAVHLPLQMTVQGAGCLLLTLATCAVAAAVVERHARRSFLESGLVAELAQQDVLTWTKNRRMFDEALGRLWRRASSDARSLAIVLIDIDYFKAYNDRYGHQAGDEALRRAAQAIQRCARRSLDLVARYGGEEFGVLLFDTGREGAATLAEAMRGAVQSLAIEHGNSRCAEVLTISVGVAVVEPTAWRNPYGALQLADEALYQAKSKGRNRVEVMDDVEHRLLVTGEFSKDIIGQLRSGMAPADGAATNRLHGGIPRNNQPSAGTGGPVDFPAAVPP